MGNAPFSGDVSLRAYTRRPDRRQIHVLVVAATGLCRRHVSVSPQKASDFLRLGVVAIAAASKLSVRGQLSPIHGLGDDQYDFVP